MRVDEPGHKLAPQVGLEPTTLRLTAECSAIELLRSVFIAELSSTKVTESARVVKILRGVGLSEGRAAAIGLDSIASGRQYDRAEDY